MSKLCVAKRFPIGMTISVVLLGGAIAFPLTWAWWNKPKQVVLDIPISLAAHTEEGIQPPPDGGLGGVRGRR